MAAENTLRKMLDKTPDVYDGVTDGMIRILKTPERMKAMIEYVTDNPGVETSAIIEHLSNICPKIAATRKRS